MATRGAVEILPEGEALGHFLHMLSTSSAYVLYAGTSAIMLEMTSPLRVPGWVSAYSMARIPPHDWP
jgi:hypothetical protein